MKRAFRILTYVFAAFGVVCFLWLLVWALAPGAYILYRDHVTLKGVMKPLGMAAQQYAMDRKDPVFPLGNDEAVTAPLIAEKHVPDELLKHSMNDKGQFVDDWRRPLLFVSTGNRLCIVSRGLDGKLGTRDDLVWIEDGFPWAKEQGKR